MADVFDGGPGFAAVVRTEALMPALIYFGNDAAVNQQAFNLAILGVGFSPKVNAQFLNTFRDYCYIYVFNDQPFDMVISGVGFFMGCIDPDTFSPLGIHGLNYIAAFYDKNKITNRAKPILIAVGVLGFKAFLLGTSIEVMDAETQIARFTFYLKCSPNIAIPGQLY